VQHLKLDFSLSGLLAVAGAGWAGGRALSEFSDSRARMCFPKLVKNGFYSSFCPYASSTGLFDRQVSAVSRDAEKARVFAKSRPQSRYAA
jgi:hypothetical protein